MRDPPTFGDPQPLFRLPDGIMDIGAGPNLDEFLLSINQAEEGRSEARILLNFPKMIGRER